MEPGISIPHGRPAAEAYLKQSGIGDTAFISGRMKIHDAVTYPKNPDLDLRFLEVWIKRNGEWKFVQWQATRVTPEGLAREKRFKTAAGTL